MTRIKKASVLLPVSEERLANFKNVLICLNRQDYPDFEVVIISNEGPKTERLIQKYLQKTHQFKAINSTKNRSVGFNTAAKIAKGQILVASNSDFLMEPNYISQILKNYQGSEDIIVTRGTHVRLIQPVSNLKDLFRLRTLPYRFWNPFLTPSKIQKIFQKSPWKTGICAISKVWYWKLGRLDENFNGLGYEDLDFNYRAWKTKKLKFVLDQTIYLYHQEHPKNFQDLIEQRRNMKLFIQKHGFDPFRRYRLQLYLERLIEPLLDKLI